MTWVLTTSLAALRRDLNTAFPNRDKSSDGTIGDAAHQASTSGHNPDDTAGSRSEYTDADTKPEVRAYDADNDLRDPRGIDFQQVIDRILATPADRDRLAYIIHRRKIWRRRNGWRQENYTGSSPHTEHAHFSGDPAQDENGAPFTSILSFGGSMSTASENAAFNADNALYAMNTRAATYKAAPAGHPAGTTTIPVPNVMMKIEEKIDILIQRPAAGNVTPSPEQWAALTASIVGLLETLFAEKVGAAVESGVEAKMGEARFVFPEPPPQ